MAEGRIYYSTFTTPPAPAGRIFYSHLSLPEGATGRIYHSMLTTPSAPTAVGRIYHGALTTPAAPDAVPPSGVRQLASSGAWWDVAVGQRTSAGEWI